MKLKAFLSTFLILPLFLSVPVSRQYLLPTPTSVEKLEMIRVIGIDRMGDGIRLSMAAASTKGGDKESGGEENYVIHGSGMTFSQAVEDAEKTANKLLFWGHADIIVFGEETAKEDISKYIDFLVRDQKTKLSARLMVVKGGTAEDLLKRKGHEKQAIYDGLTEQLLHMKENSVASEVSLADTIASVGNMRTSYLVPLIAFEGEENYEIDGAAVLYQGKVQEILEERFSKAALLVRGEFYRGLDVLETNLLGRVSVDAGNAFVKKKFFEEQGGVAAVVEISLTGTLAEQFAPSRNGEDRFTSATMEDVGLLWSGKLRTDIEEILWQDQRDAYDRSGLGEDLYRANPALYERYRSSGQMTVYLSVLGKMERVHVIDKEI